tara:strand:+ start:1086 stop:1250 length:165 start_codon:yes stop_codon:yes gene_type:complete
MIRVGDLVRGFYFDRKIGVVLKINNDNDVKMALVQFMDTTECWEPIENIRKVAA